MRYEQHTKIRHTRVSHIAVECVLCKMACLMGDLADGYSEIYSLCRY